MKKSNLSVNSKMNSNFWAKLKALFALPKWAKIFLGVLSIVAVAGLLGTFALQSWAKDKIQHGEFVLNGTDKSWQERLESGFAYDSRLYFEKADFLLRSKVIAYIDIRDISWVSPIDKNAIIELKSQNRHIKFSTSQNLSKFNGQKLGVVEYKMDFSPLAKTAIKYYFVLTICLIGVCVFFNSLKIYPWQNEILPLTKKDYIFLAFAFLLCAGICAFSFWLGFRGYITSDLANVYIDLQKNNWHPVFVTYVVELLYFLFGRHLYYLFLFNLIPFYLGLFFLIASFYIRCRSPFVFLLLFPTFIGNIYFENFVQNTTFSLSMLLFCLYSLMLFLILIPLNTNKVQQITAKILWTFLFVLMFFAILWRHNAIFSVFPVFFVLCYLFLKDKKINARIFAKYYVSLVLLSAILCISIIIGVPKILVKTKDDSYPANHTFLHQIAGACVPANDSLCFKDEWYDDGKTFDDVKELYKKYPLAADPFSFPHGYESRKAFKYGKLTQLHQQWFKSIAKHPYYYIQHQIRFIKALWWSYPSYWVFDAQLREPLPYYFDLAIYNKIEIKKFPQNEHYTTLNPIKKQIYNFFYNNKIIINHSVGVIMSFILMTLCVCILTMQKHIKNTNNTLLIFVFSISFASFWSAFFTAIFTPVADNRYMSPVFAMSIVALVGFIAFWFDYLARKKVD